MDKKQANTLLFVDDEPFFLAGIKRMLHDMSDRWQIHTAESADQALEVIGIQPVDVLITDINMPKKDGFWLLEEMQRETRTRSIPVIILTGSGESHQKRKALEAGATDLLNKPIEYADLVARITNCLRLKKYQDEIIEKNETLEAKVRKRTAELEYLHHDIVWRLAKVGEMHDGETGNHVVRVAGYSRLISMALGLSQKEIDLIYLTAPLHDLGKIGIPDTILLKSSRLTKEEWAVMSTHCELGAKILLEQPKGLEMYSSPISANANRYLANDQIRNMAAQIARSHHEKWDGTGYPQGLAGDTIPLAGRIVSFADVYDALRSERPYKRPFTAEETWDLLGRESGKHFDPQVLQVATDKREQLESIFLQYRDAQVGL